MKKSEDGLEKYTIVIGQQYRHWDFEIRLLYMVICFVPTAGITVNGKKSIFCYLITKWRKGIETICYEMIRIISQGM